MHPETELIPFVRGQLDEADHARVAAHLAACEECRRATEDSRVVLAALAARQPAPPAVDWGRYQAEPVPTVAVAALIAVAVLVGVHGLERVTERPGPDVVAMDQTVLGAQLPLLRQYRVVERLDMLEDLEVIRQLDRLGGTP
jgi:hypothetical protein